MECVEIQEKSRNENAGFDMLRKRLKNLSYVVDSCIVSTCEEMADVAREMIVVFEKQKERCVNLERKSASNIYIKSKSGFRSGKRKVRMCSSI